jgi:Rrf2 family protein
MMFSTRAEYGVRVMAHLAGRVGQGPTSLTTIAEAEGLPPAYLEHLAARLRRAELVESRRGAHGGYSLSRPAEDITMAEVVRALEGEIAPIECITADADGALTCAREGEAGHEPCPTKLLWTRVQGSIVRTLTEMTLADLVGAAQPRRSGEAEGRADPSDRGARRPAEVAAHRTRTKAEGPAEPGRSREAGSRKSTSDRGAGRPAEVISNV